MMSASSASSTLSRSTATVLLLTTLAAAYGIYYIHDSIAQEPDTASSNPASGLRRSNAIHPRRRRNTSVIEDAPPAVDGPGENNEDGTALVRALTDGETVVDDQVFPDDYSWTDVPPSYQRTGQNVVQLLFRVSEDATRRNAYVHRGCICNGCGVVPVRGIRYRCANCTDYDLCEGCESQGLHTKTHIFYKIRVPAPSFGTRQIQPLWYSGDPDSVMRVLPKELITKLSRETGFERPELDAYWEQWTFMANTDWRDDPDDINLAMDRKTFERCLVPSGGYRNAAPSLIFDRMFSFYDTNKDDLISFPEFLHGLAYRKKKDKWIKIFEGYDIDGDGYVDRRDFLRMFRSYYVLNRHMHRDILEGLDDQQMSSTDAHRLVNSRQPLSSAFGQDGRYPAAPDPRTGEGKTSLPNGDLEISDGKGVINESSNDTANREDLLRTHVTSSGQSLWNDARDRNNGGYWDVMLNPPETAEQVPEVLDNFRRVRGNEDPEREVLNAHPALVQQQTLDSDDSSSDGEGGFSSGPENDQPWLPGSVSVTDGGPEAENGLGTHGVRRRRSSRRAVITEAIRRERAEREIHERWKRRQFYTDEEEGATPPANWAEEEDILVQNGLAGECSKAQSQTRPTLHSRSSSKVRFAEDTEDFETRSNPSTSSRSVPERWGGMDIPDAERDAGKEILYQVTQQAFNELLDPLFKAKEDLAVEAAMTAQDREKHKAKYTTQEFEEWALKREAEELKQTRGPPKMTPVVEQQMWPGFPGLPEVDIEEVRERPLDELLATTGYSVELADDGSDGMPDLVEIPGSEIPLSRHGQYHAGTGDLITSVENDGRNMPENGNRELTQDTRASEPPTSPIEALSAHAQYEVSDIAAPQSRSVEASLPAPSLDSAISGSYRDPTLPQFRPNSVPVTTQKNLASTTPQLSSNGVSQRQDNGISNNDTAAAPDEVDKEKLYTLWRCNRAIKEAEQRGGWGKLSFEEFQRLVKRFVREGKGNQMDYLGSWIDFCIP